MKLNKTGFDDLLLIEVNFFYDFRGSFFESWRENEYKKLGINEVFIQDNISISKKNILRGLHFQKNQGQLVTVVHGKIFDVAVDLRPNSKTYKNYFSIELNSKNPKQLYMPPGFAHGFCVLSDLAIINYKCTQYYNSKDEGGIIWNDPSIDIKWPLNDHIISERDSSFPKLGHNYDRICT
ncbi:dTDP-4-dehydrorhamnose 3,5-epimerase [Fluviispira multicolorata]|uniref:dTDP-4-dehydrorhamnose 3,5-epimerase n=1 Tax=Fluviispira multicolorata TaxID=2654512 RepID=A0A833JD52_9BACT|nr:dTDP-4-dehydrorhamnose 3,5-epimerase [Fluviispira multicolorata]KAB8028017.1 dTDP-4-dehydrorhamnose 3,5-epimerase [Fluviispira multicolorata]